MSEKIELKQCPFCKAKAVPVDDTFQSEHGVICEENCGAFMGWFLTKEEAAEAWNRRADLPASDSSQRNLVKNGL